MIETNCENKYYIAYLHMFIITDNSLLSGKFHSLNISALRYNSHRPAMSYLFSMHITPHVLDKYPSENGNKIHMTSVLIKNDQY
jgi:hypothetical protein